MNNKKSLNLSNKPVKTLINMLKKEKGSQKDVFEALHSKKAESIKYIVQKIVKSLKEENPADVEFYLGVLGEIADNEKDLELLESKIKPFKDSNLILFSAAGFLRQINDIQWLKHRYSTKLNSKEKLTYFLALLRHSKAPEDFIHAMEFMTKHNYGGNIQQQIMAAAYWIYENGIQGLEDYVLNTSWEETLVLREALRFVLRHLLPSGEGYEGVLKSVKNILIKGLEGDLPQQKNALLILESPREEYNKLLFEYLKSKSFWVQAYASRYLKLIKEDDCLKAVEMVEQLDDTSLKTNLLVKTQVVSKIVESKLYKLYPHQGDAQKFWILVNLNNAVSKINKDRFLNRLKGNIVDENNFALRYYSAVLLKEQGELEDKQISSWEEVEQIVFDGKFAKKDETLQQMLLKNITELAVPLMNAYVVEDSNSEYAEFIKELIKKAPETLIDDIIDIAENNRDYTSVAIELASLRPTPKTVDFLIDLAVKCYNEDNEWQFNAVCESLTKHIDFRVKIADELIPLMEDATHPYLFSLIQSLASLRQPRLLPKLFKRIQKGEVYGMLWNHSIEWVSYLCFEKRRALEYIMKVFQEEKGIKQLFAEEVINTIKQIQEEKSGQH